MTNEIYVDVRHSNFWWGIYGFTSTTDWEDLDFYEKQGEDFVCLGGVCVCAKKYFSDAFDDPPETPQGEAYRNDIRQFLEAEVITYHYWYDKPDDKDFYEVPFEAERNSAGIKPSYIEMWHPGDGIDVAAVKACTIAFCKKFLNRDVDNVLPKEIPPFEEAVADYQEFRMHLRQQPAQIVFTDELVESLAREWRKSKDEVLRILNKSVDRQG